MMDVFYIEFLKNIDTKSESESDSKSVRKSQTVEGTLGEPEVIIQPMKEENEEVSKPEDVTAASNDSLDKLERDEVTVANESFAQVELKELETAAEEDEITPEVIESEVSVPVMSASVPVKEVETGFPLPADPARKKRNKFCQCC